MSRYNGAYMYVNLKRIVYTVHRVQFIGLNQPQSSQATFMTYSLFILDIIYVILTTSRNPNSLKQR